MTAEGGKTTTTTTTTMTTTTAVADQIEKAARRSAASLNREALLSAYESNYALSRHRGGKGRTEQAPCREVAEANERSTERDCLAAELEGVREELRRRGGGRRRRTPPYSPSARGTRNSETWAELELAGKHTDRMDREADGLRAEISRLARSNGESAVNDRTSRNVERSQGRTRDAELEHASRREMLQRDLDKEREWRGLRNSRRFLRRTGAQR